MITKEVLELHRKWMKGENGGSRADLSYSDLRGSNLSGSNLSGSNLSYSDLSDSDLSDSDLRHADLRGSNLSGSNLRGAIGNMREIKSMQIDTWLVTYTADRLQIGCENHAIQDWFEFSDERIHQMDSDALEWWRKYRDVIKMVIETSPAEETTCQ